MIKILLVVALLGADGQRTAPSTLITGVVTSARTGAPVADAQVTITPDTTAVAGTAPSADRAVGTRTDAAGRFEVPGIQSGPATLTISTIGYIFIRRRIVVPATGVLELALPLAEGTGTYQESVNVTAPPDPLPAGEVRELSSGALQDLRGVAADDPVRAVQALPGVAASDDFQAEFSVRGAAYRHLGIVIDGVATPLLFHSVRGSEDTGSIAMINTDVISRAALHTGAHPAEHGSWLGATLEFDIRQGSRDRLAVRGAVSGTSASTVIEGPVGPDRRGSWLLSVRKSYVDWLVRKIDPSIESTVGFIDTQAKVVFDVTTRQQVQLLVLGGHAVYRKPSATSANEIARATSASTLVSGAWRHAGERVLASQRVSMIGNRFRNSGLLFQERARGDTRAVVWRSDVTIPAGALLLKGGTNVERQHTSTVLRNFAVASPTTVRVRAERSFEDWRTIASGWMSAATRVAGTGISGGLRVSRDSLTGRAHASPWLMAERPFRGTRFIVSASRAVQYPSIESVAASSSPVLAEQAWLIDAGARRQFTKTLSWSAMVFRRNEWDVLRRTNENRLANGQRIVESVFPTAASLVAGTSTGTDLVIERRSELGASGWIAYSWAHTRHRDASTAEVFDGDFDQRHTLNVFVQQRLSYRLRVSGKFRYGSHIPIVGYFEGTPEALFLGSLRNRVRLPAYARLDLNASRTFTFSRSRLTLFVEVMNVSGRDNFGPAEGSVRNNFTAVNFTDRLIPTVPSAGVLLEF